MNEKHAVEARSVIVRDVTDDQLIMSNGEGQNHEGKVEVKKGIFDTKIKKLTILCISLYWFIICCAYSMIAPFFPGEVSSIDSFTFLSVLNRKISTIFPR